MALHVIVDGYNFLHASARLSELLPRDLEAARHALIQVLGRYRRSRGHQVSVVFDCARGVALPLAASRKSTVGGVGVIFSRPGQEADAVIGEMARRAGMKAVVVTADTALAEACRRSGAAITSPAEFEALLTGGPEAGGGEAGDEEDEDDEGGPKGRKKGPARKPPRSERRERLRKKKL